MTNWVPNPSNEYPLPRMVNGQVTMARRKRPPLRAQESRHKVPKSVLRAVLGRMQFTLHATRQTPHGASRLVQAMSAWLGKTRRAPSWMRGSMVIRLRPYTNAQSSPPFPVRAVKKKYYLRQAKQKNQPPPPRGALNNCTLIHHRQPLDLLHRSIALGWACVIAALGATASPDA